MASPNDTYFRKGFGLKSAVQGTLAADYSARLVDLLRANDHSLEVDEVTIRLAHEFGFCYGVERAVEYAYQTRAKFPDRRIVLVGEIIHNPHVNTRMREMGIEILLPVEGEFDYSGIVVDDVVILPAFGVTMKDFETLRGIGCVVVDTTCGSVLHVWKRVDSYGRDAFTALIHGKHYHEETRATASQITRYDGGQYIIVRDMAETERVIGCIEGRISSEDLMSYFAPHAVSPGFSPDEHLRRVGVANQTTMLARESLAIAAAVGDAMERVHGPEYRAEHFRSFDTICSATQDRQDAVLALLEESLDVMVVIGGYNSSNTMSLAAICAERVPTYHIEDATCIEPESGVIRYKPVGRPPEAVQEQWCSFAGPVRVGLTAGASTPNNKIGDAVARILATRGIGPDRLPA